MSLLNSLSEMFRRSAAGRPGWHCRPGRSTQTRRLNIESLEERTLLSYSFTLIADDGGPYILGRRHPSINARGTVAFHTPLSAGGEALFTCRANHQGDQRCAGNRLTLIADTSGDLSTFSNSPTINRRGTVAFGADLTQGDRGLFTGNGRGLTTVADNGVYSPFSVFPETQPVIVDDGTVAFRANLRSGGEGIFVRRGDEPPRILYVTGGLFSDFTNTIPYVTAEGTVVFRATLTAGGEGIFTGNGRPVTTLADTSDGTYSAFGIPGMSAAGTVAFRATLSAGGQVIMTNRDGNLAVVADASGPYRDFGSEVAINSAGLIAFRARLTAGGAGIFTGPDPVADKVLATGDSLFGSTAFCGPGPPDTTPFLSRGLNDAGQLVTYAPRCEGGPVIVRIDPERDGGRASGGADGKHLAHGPDVVLVLAASEESPTAPIWAPGSATRALVFSGPSGWDAAPRPELLTPSEPTFARSAEGGLGDLAQRGFEEVTFGALDFADPLAGP